METEIYHHEKNIIFKKILQKKPKSKCKLISMEKNDVIAIFSFSLMESVSPPQFGHLLCYKGWGTTRVYFLHICDVAELAIICSIV
jgi:hypothetical protein